MEGEEEEMIKSIKPLTTCILIFAFCGFFGLFMSFRAPLSDFGNYYYGSKIAWERDGFYHSVYDVASFNGNVQELGEKNLFLDHATVAPTSMVLYLPLTWIANAHTAKIMFNIAGLLFFPLVLYRFLKWKNIEITWPLVALILAAQVPIYYNLSFGQTYLIVTGFIMIAIMCADTHPWVGGVLLGISICLKISPALFLIWFLTQRKFKVIIGAIFTTAVIVSAVESFGKMRLHVYDFYSYNLPRMMDGFISDPFTSSFQSVIVFLRKLMLPDAILNPNPLINGSERLVQLFSVLAFIVLAFFLVRAWKESQDVRKKFVLLILFLCITSGYTSTYSLILLLPFIIVGNTRKDWIRAGLYSIAFSLPPRIFDGYSPFMEEYKLWIFIALFIWESKVEFGFRKIEKMQLVLSLMLVGMVIFKFAHRPEELPLRYYKPDAIKHDYVFNAFVGDSTIEYLTYTEGGFKQFSVPYDGVPNYEGQKNSEGKEAYHVGGVRWDIIGETATEYLVVSDYHRGPGLTHLYTLRKDYLQSMLNP
jgi:hypothetical protein